MAWLITATKPIWQWALAALAKGSINLIRAHIEKSDRHEAIDKDVEDVEKAVKNIESYQDETNRPKVPPKMERELRHASKKLVSNFKRNIS